MKILKFIVVGMVLFFANNLLAQVTANLHIGSPPQWGPVGHSAVRYYYLPDIETYYDVRKSNFIYYEGGSWIHRKKLPIQYRNYDLYNGYKVVMTDYHGNSPYVHFNDYKIKYKKGYHGTFQKTYGMKPGKGNPNSKMKSKGNSKGKSHKNKH